MKRSHGEVVEKEQAGRITPQGFCFFSNVVACEAGVCDGAASCFPTFEALAGAFGPVFAAVVAS